jgi:hypothetical protein
MQDLDARCRASSSCPEVTDVTVIEADDTELRSRMRRYAEA